MGILSIFGCNRYEKIYSDSIKFNKLESSAKINATEAVSIYESTFVKNFKIEKKEDYNLNHDRVIYIQNGYYFIGYVSKYDKRGKKDGFLYFLAKINSETGIIAVVK